MLFQKITFPSSVFSFSYTSILPSLRHLHVLTPLVLSVSSIDTISTFPIHELVDVVYAIDGFTLAEEEKLQHYLDHGLSLAIVHLDASMNSLTIEQQEFLSSFPRQRLGVNITGENIEAMITKYRTLFNHFIIRDLSSTHYPAVIAWIRNILKKNEFATEVYLHFNDDTITLGERIAVITNEECLHLLESPRFHVNDLLGNSDLAAIAPALPSSDLPDIVSIFKQTIKTDRLDGLFTTVIIDENEKSLGLVYSNEQSLRQAFFEQKGIYWSRSRNILWRKGDVSGMGQSLLQIRLDCDRDAIRMKVIQLGQPPSFCHLMTRTCWGNDHGLTKMERVLKERKVNAPAGSYTKRLFDDEDLLRKKLLEEVQELVEAKDHDHIAAEAADVLYFLMTRCVAADVSLADIERQLDLRSLKITRRPGNAKEWRTQAAEKVRGLRFLSVLSFNEITDFEP